MERILLRGRRDLTGQTHGRWTVLYPVEVLKRRCAVYACRCLCGTARRVRGDYLLSGKSSSCGCYQPQAVSDATGTHYRRRTSLYGRWRGMINACELPTASNYRSYGGRGIAVCERWRQSFEDFAADVGEPPLGMQLRRKDGEGDFELDNVEWRLPRRSKRGQEVAANRSIDNANVAQATA